jgi:4-amino-4-deoxy-L-arabinose transferase-like glycosyltransferase
VLYLWNLTASGYANTYYSAAAQAASQDLAAWFFGSIDAAGFITIDKPPLSLWVMGLSVRLLGLGPFAILLPQALAGVASVVVLYLGVTRQFGPGAGVIAGVAFALTPVAALMFRYNNPDAVLTLLLVAAAWALVRGLESERFRWPILAAVLVGFAFLTKYLQAYLVLPAFALTYLVAARGDLRHRLVGLVASGGAVVASSLWWVALMELIPAASRPYIGGSTTNSAIELLLGYDGLGRIFGAAGPGGWRGGPGGPGGFGGDPGLTRMLNAQWAGEVGWLLPGAAVGLVVGLAARIRAPRTDPRRAGYLLWGTWAVVHVLVFSLMSGIAHPYYAVALAPAVAALFGAGIAELWRLRERVPWAGLVLGATLVLTAWWCLQILGRTPSFAPGVGTGALLVTIAAALVIAVPQAEGDRRAARIATGALGVGLAAVLVGPALYTAATMTKAIAGGDPAAGPEDGAFGGFGPGRFPGDAAGTNEELIAYLVANHGEERWLAAVTSANQAGPLQLQTGIPVMAMGGFMGSDPAPTTEQLRAYVRDGRLRFVLLGGAAGGGGFFGGDVAAERTAWVTERCGPVALAGSSVSLYDCAGAAD